MDSGSSKRWLPQTPGALRWGVQAGLPLCSARGTLTAEGPEGSSASPVRQAGLRLPSGIAGAPKPPPTSTFRPKGRGRRTEAGGPGHSPGREGGSARSGHHLPFRLTAGRHAEEQTGHRLISQAPRSWAGLCQLRHSFLSQGHREPGGLAFPKHTPKVAGRKFQCLAMNTTLADLGEVRNQQEIL